MDKETLIRRQNATKKFWDRYAEVKIKYHNLPEKTADEYWKKCKELKDKNVIQ